MRPHYPLPTVWRCSQLHVTMMTASADSNEICPILIKLEGDANKLENVRNKYHITNYNATEATSPSFVPCSRGLSPLKSSHAPIKRNFCYCSVSSRSSVQDSFWLSLRFSFSSFVFFTLSTTPLSISPAPSNGSVQKMVLPCHSVVHQW